MLSALPTTYDLTAYASNLAGGDVLYESYDGSPVGTGAPGMRLEDPGQWFEGLEEGSGGAIATAVLTAWAAERRFGILGAVVGAALGYALPYVGLGVVLLTSDIVPKPLGLSFARG